MILDQLIHAHYYFGLHAGFKKAFEFIQKTKNTPFEPQRIQLDGEDLIAILEAPESRGHSGARLEAHRKYIDIQYTFSGTEEIGWKPYHECRQVTQPYSQEKDIEFFGDFPTLWLPIPAETFAIFFPHDAHAPLAASKPVRKIIMKVAVNQSLAKSFAIEFPSRSNQK